MQTKYEVLNKETGIWTPVLSVAIGNEEVTFSTDTEDVTFSNEGAIGDLQNDTHSVRIIDTKGQADGSGSVNDEGQNTDTEEVIEVPLNENL